MSGVSAFKNVIRRRAHKERAQPYARAKLGLLEKHKDYKLRAIDFHRKKDHLDALRKKAAFKNPDEFYHKMKSSSTKDGVHVVERNNTKTTATVAKWKLQDASYLQTRLITTTKQIARLQANLQLLSAGASKKKQETGDSSDEDSERDDEGRQNQKVVFMDSDDAKTALPVSAVLPSLPPEVEKKLKRQTTKEYKRLEKLKSTKELIEKELQKLQLQRQLIGSRGKVKKIVTEDKFGEEDTEKTRFQWKLQRTR